MKSVAEIIEKLQNEKEKGIYYTERANEYEFVSYHDMYLNCLHILYELNMSGIEKEDFLILLPQDNRNMVELFWACILGGIIPIPLPREFNQEQIKKLINIYYLIENIRIYCGESDRIALEKEMRQLNLYDKHKEMFCNVILREKMNMDKQGSGKVCYTEEKETAFIQFSSGSTEQAKGVVLSHRNLLENIISMTNHCNVGKDDFYFSWLPLSHDMGVIGLHLWPTFLGANQVLMNTALFLEKPMLWMSGCSKFKATVSCSPNFGFQHFISKMRNQKQDWDLSAIRYIFNGSEPINVDVVKKFYDTLGCYHLKKTAILLAYGMAESTLAATIAMPDMPLKYLTVNRNCLELGDKIEFVSEEDKEAINFGSCGPALDSFKIKVVNNCNEELPQETVGSILMKSVCNMSGYYQDKEKTDKVFTEDGWLITGDLGFLYDNELYIVGRKKDVIIVNGVNYYSYDLERICIESEWPEDVKFIAASIRERDKNTEKLAIFVVFRGNLKEFLKIETKVRRLLSSKAGIKAAYVIPVDEYYQTSSGKIQRFMYTRKFNLGEYDDVIAQLKYIQKEKKISDWRQDNNKIKEMLIKIIQDELEIKEVDIYENLSELGADSVHLINIYSRIKEMTGKKIDISDFYANPSIYHLYQFLSAGSDEIQIVDLEIEEDWSKKILKCKQENNISEQDIIYGVSTYVYMFVEKIDRFVVKIDSSNHIDTFLEVNTQNITSKKDLYRTFAEVHRKELMLQDETGILFDKVKITADWNEKKIYIQFFNLPVDKRRIYLDSLIKALTNV